MRITFRSLLVFLFDLSAVAVAMIGGMLIRFNFSWPSSYNNKVLLCIAVLLIIHAFACRWAGLYRGMWRFASLPDLKRVLKAIAISSLGLLAFVAIDRSSGPAIPRSMLVLYPILLLIVMGGGRAAWRMWKEHRLYGDLIAAGKPVVVVGAGTGGAMLVRELERSPDWRVVALVDDDPAKQGLEVLGVAVIGTIDELPVVLSDFKARHVILAMPSAATEARRRATDLAAKADAQVFTVPGLDDLMAGKVAINAMRPVQIEDLLGRNPVRIDNTNIHAMVRDKTVLVTGAGGSIGSELCHQLARFDPARIVLLELNEFALYQMEQWFSIHYPDIPVSLLAGDVRDVNRINQIFETWRPQIVFHAAAYKHVPLMEVDNADQAMSNNVLGTLRVGEHAMRYAAERFVLISTDKAVNPTNVMGATKRLAEMVCLGMQQSTSRTQFETVRFGNVLGSTGSVIPKFREQIAAGGPVTVTHPDITRYFMSIPEASQLVLQAASMGSGGEIFVLDMGEPVRIVDLARNMIRLSGYTENEIRITFTGLRPGEKLFEELLADTDETCPTPHPQLRIARARPVPTDLLNEIRDWLVTERAVTDEDVRKVLTKWVPEYAPYTQTCSDAPSLSAADTTARQPA